MSDVPLLTDVHPKRATVGEPPIISVIIPTLNEEQLIARCLGSLSQSRFPKDQFEVIVADNGSTDGTIERARASSGSLNLAIITQPEERVSGLRNLAAASARGNFLAFLDADCLVPKGWLGFAVNQLSKPGAGVIGGYCGIPENSPWVPRVWYADRQLCKRGSVSYIPGANLFVSRANFLMIGGFDESLETNEDCELCERARQKGLTVIAYSELGVVHLRDPQTVWAFYRKQAWHGKNVFKVFLRNLPSMVNVRPVFFALFTLLTLVGAAVSFLQGQPARAGMWVGLLLFPCLLLSLRIAVRRRRWSDFLPLIVLHFAYGAGRVSALLNPHNWGGASKTSERVKAGRADPMSRKTT